VVTSPLSTATATRPPLSYRAYKPERTTNPNERTKTMIEELDKKELGKAFELTLGPNILIEETEDESDDHDHDHSHEEEVK
jgi:hypothetical protein